MLRPIWQFAKFKAQGEGEAGIWRTYNFSSGCYSGPQVTLGSQQLRTVTFRQTLNPSYYEAMEMEVILPEMKQLAPDIVVRGIFPLQFLHLLLRPLSNLYRTLKVMLSV